MIMALAPTDRLVSHLDRALDNGVTQEELTFYAAWLWGINTATTLQQAVNERKNEGSLR
jgi:hypothetical protein